MHFINTKELKDIWKSHYIKIIALFVLIVGSIILISIYGKNINQRELKRIMHVYKGLSIFIFLLIYTLKSFFVVLPSVPLIVFAGSVYGPIGGFILSMTGATLSATTSFLISRRAGPDFIHRLLGNRAKFLNNKVDNYGIRIIAIMRAAFVIPFDILSYLAGLTKMKYRDFIGGTLIGIVAEIFSLAYFGANLRRPGSKGFIYSILTIIVVIAVPIIYSKISSKKNPIYEESNLTNEVKK